MSLNPFRWIIGPVADAVGTWQERKAKAKEVEGRIQEARIGYKLARIEAKTRRTQEQAKADMSYDMQVLRNRQHTWIDEFIVVAIVLMTALAFIPYTHPYVEAGWQAVAQAPFWFQFAWVTMIASTLGGLAILRIMLGRSTQNTVRDVVKRKAGELPPPKDATPEEGSTVSERGERGADYPFRHPEK